MKPKNIKPANYIMIKDVFKFKKDSWHMRLMSFIWGYEYYDFRNMCPYFWLSVFNVLIAAIPVIFVKYTWRMLKFVGRNIRKSVLAMEEAYAQYCERQDGIWREKIRAQVAASLDNPRDGDIVDLYLRNRRSSRYSPIWRKLNSKLIDYLETLIDWDVYDPKELSTAKLDRTFKPITAAELAKLQAEREVHWKAIEENARIAHEARVKAEYDAKIARQRRIGKMTSIIKSSAKYLAVAIVLFAAYWLYRLGVIAVDWISYWLDAIDWFRTWEIVWEITYILAVIIILAALAILIVYLLLQLIRFLWCKYGAYCVPCEERRDALTKGVAKIVAFFLYPFVNLYPMINGDYYSAKPGFVSRFFVWIVGGVKGLWQVLVSMKRDNCPAIEWED